MPYHDREGLIEHLDKMATRDEERAVSPELTAHLSDPRQVRWSGALDKAAEANGTPKWRRIGAPLRPPPGWFPPLT